MSVLISEEGAALLALLLAGHCLGDFVFQTEAMVRGKRRHWRYLLEHGFQVLVVQALVLLPFYFDRGAGLLAVLVVALIHIGVDRSKLILEKRTGPTLRWFTLDQVAHVLSLVLVVLLWAGAIGAPSPGPLVVDPQKLIALGLIVAAYSFAIRGGSGVVSGVLRGLRPERDRADLTLEPQAGHLIGVLERLLMVTLVWLGEWGAIGFVLAAKSVARFKELDDKRFAEAYLVGTLTSVLVASALGLALRLLLD